MKFNLNNKKFGEPRLYWRKEKGKKCPSVLIKCECCNQKVEIYYENGNHEGKYLEINGVNAEYQFWKELFEKIGLLTPISSRERKK